MSRAEGRLSQSQKRSFKKHHGLVDDITHVRYAAREAQQLIIAHIRPVAIGGDRSRENLALLHQETEKKINELAMIVASSTGENVHEVMERLTRDAIELFNIEQ